MERIYKIIIVDDNKNAMTDIMETVKLELRFDKININYEILDNGDSVDRIDKLVGDVFMFDCNLSSMPIKFINGCEFNQGFELIGAFRKNNKRSKIIFYSGTFEKEGYPTFDANDFVKMINDFNVFKISPRRAEVLAKNLKLAIEDLDSILISMEGLITDFGEDGSFDIDGAKLTGEQLLKELQLGTNIGEKFRTMMNDGLLLYFMKFGEKK
jgi:hypothetical protein